MHDNCPLKVKSMYGTWKKDVKALIMYENIIKISERFKCLLTCWGDWCWAPSGKRWWAGSPMSGTHASGAYETLDSPAMHCQGEGGRREERGGTSGSSWSLPDQCLETSWSSCWIQILKLLLWLNCKLTVNKVNSLGSFGCKYSSPRAQGWFTEQRPDFKLFTALVLG